MTRLNFKKLAMRILLSLICLFTFAGFMHFTEDDTVYTIEPGSGLNDIKLGMGYKDFTGILGIPYEHRTYAKEKKTLKKADIDCMTLIQFKIGFDYVLLYYKKNNKSPYPIYKAYFKEDKLVMLNISSYVYELADCKKKFKLPGGLTFGASDGLITSEYGQPDEKSVYLNDNLDYIYKKKGISFIINQKENALRVVEVFKPMD